MTRALSTEEPCAANVACTVLKASEGGDPFAEPNRALRPAVIARKVSQCSKNERGAAALSAFKSVICTLKKSGGNVLEKLTRLISPSPPPQTASATTP
jgi:hypothetical protein